jgi:alpha-mannosidase
LSQIDTRGEGVPVAVFNTLGWIRTDLAQADVGFAEHGITSFTVVDPAGNAIPSQLLEAERYGDRGLKRVKLAFIAREIPPLGHSVYHVLSHGVATDATFRIATTNVLENEFYTLRFDRATGALTNLFVKDGGWEALAAPANVVAREPDKGDFWELYKNLDGFQNVMMTRPLPVPKNGPTEFSDEPLTNHPSASFRRGPVFSQYEVKRPFGSGTFATAVRLYAGIPRIDFETKILNNDKSVRYRLLVPTAIQHGRGFHEIPFGAIERPFAQEFPAQNWIDYSDAQRGVALLNRGLPGNNIADGTLMLSLMRSTRIQNYGVGGGFENQSSDSGLELGKELTFHYALAPHSGDWRQARVARSGLEFNNPLIVRKSSNHSGRLPNRWGLLEVSEPNVLLSALKPGKAGTTILRVYETGGKAVSDVAIKVHAKILAAHEANLMEDAGAKLKFAHDSFRLSLHPFEIKTCELKLRQN